MGTSAGRIVFTVAVLAVFVGAIVYTAISARIAVERDAAHEAGMQRDQAVAAAAAEEALHRELERVVDAAARRLAIERTAAGDRQTQRAGAVSSR